ncbi:hypothetical protein FH972_023944 [Carpinus fangiana]|uniref:Protein kinase domain-containing protein n=1 Tax=Carpinus fangiana TaxID=176857 RepID=A0A5N6KWM7_9ROSI|nr:hypothetical protein FH972_023944 [Carpinus fangiana]
MKVPGLPPRPPSPTPHHDQTPTPGSRSLPNRLNRITSVLATLAILFALIYICSPPSLRFPRHSKPTTPPRYRGPGVGFDLTLDYATVSLHTDNGTTNVARVDGSPSYRRLMRCVDVVDGVPRLCDDDIDGGALTRMLAALKGLAEVQLDQQVQSAGLSVPWPAGGTEMAEFSRLVDEAYHGVGLEWYGAAETSGRRAATLHRVHEWLYEEPVLSVDYSGAALTMVVDVLDLGGGRVWRQVWHSEELGRDAVEVCKDALGLEVCRARIVAAMRELVKGPVVSDSAVRFQVEAPDLEDIGTVLLLGEHALDPTLILALKDFFGDSFASRNIPMFEWWGYGRGQLIDPLYAASGGAAYDEEPTQQEFNTQQVERRLHKSVSGLGRDDIADVICILHPASVAAFKIVEDTAQRQRQHILQRNNFLEFDGPSQLAATEAETILIDQKDVFVAQDLALRFSSHVNNPAAGFCFGRNLMKCDINLDPDHKQNRISNIQFRVYCNPSGIVMLEDMSTNGTIVDKVTLGGKKYPDNSKMQMLSGGSIIEILSLNQDEHIKFIVRIPAREPHQDEYIANFQNYMENLAIAEERQQTAERGPPMPEAAVRGMLAAPLAGPTNPKKFAQSGLPIINNSNYGMKWDGAPNYNCIGVLGKGAFATVYHLATREKGEPYAVKELEKRRFIKNGQLDQRLDNEMKIMKDLRHPNIVQYIDYIETNQHLYIIMEYIPCGDLQGYIQSHQLLPEDMGREMSRQIFDALAYLHQRNITHRDIKPDNIMIQSEEPFVVKLTDFGLSKVVKNNETFLKTFCGTLLYCAPEVFPDWHKQPASRQRQKRRAPGSRSTHSYSQLVDIWSYAAVLWFVMCGKPPFEGIVDRGGQGMFKKIMNTTLDITPLQDCGISDDGIDLLVMMLDTDPTTRPSELDCLRHPWLNGGTEKVLQNDGNGLITIAEEGNGTVDQTGNQLDASQLNLEDRDQDDEQFESSPDELTEDHVDKRVKAVVPMSMPKTLARQNAVVGAQDASWQSVPLMMDDRPMDDASDVGIAKPQKLFGEISHRALRSSGVLGGLGDNAAWQVYGAGREEDFTNVPTLPNTEYAGDSDYNGLSPQHDVEMGDDHPHGGDRDNNAAKNAKSLNGAESMVREMHMTSPNVSGSQAETPNEPASPHTPTRSGDLGSGRPSQEKSNPLGSQEQTPKPKTNFDRFVHVPPVPSIWYDPNDKSTHNLEHASRVSGINWQDQDEVAKLSSNDFPASFSGIPARTSHSDPRPNSAGMDQENAEPLNSTAPAALGHAQSPDSTRQTSAGANERQKLTPDLSDFKAPLPRIARLTTVPGSFKDLKFNITEHRTLFGRHPQCQLVYRFPMDTRVPKISFCITFHERGTSSGQSGSSLGDMEKASAWISALSKTPLYVNGVQLDAKNAEGRENYGRLYTGDEINAARDPNRLGSLTFQFEAFAGKSREKRPDGTKFEIVAKPL